MNGFLSFAIIALLGFAGYEFYQHTQDEAGFIQQRDSLTTSIAELKKTNDGLKANQGALNDKLGTLQKQEVDLQGQASSAPAAATPAPSQ
jgi:septal ring factor EnvC (AmiA/AmiB activator)